MLQSISQFFEKRIKFAAEASEPDQAHRLHLATAALLLEMARADFDVDPDEMRVIAGLLRSYFDLDHQEIDDLIALAEQETSQAVSLFEFAQLINKEYSQEQKSEVIELLWRVAFSDQVLDKYEEHLVRKIADLIHVPHREFIHAKHRAQAASEHGDGIPGTRGKGG